VKKAAHPVPCGHVSIRNPQEAKIDPQEGPPWRERGDDSSSVNEASSSVATFQCCSCESEPSTGSAAVPPEARSENPSGGTRGSDELRRGQLGRA